MKYVAFCDGGCYTRKEGHPTPAYFSYQIWTAQNLQSFYNGNKVKPLSIMDRWYLRGLLTSLDFTDNPELLLPSNCCIFNDRKTETSNIAEYAAMYYCVQRANLILPRQAIIEILSDSELIIKQLLGEYRCNTSYLIPWRDQVRQVLKNLNATLIYTPRKYIERMLGH